jgi:hypothetical protein
LVPIHRLRGAFLNDQIYKPVRPDDPSIRELAKDIAEAGEVLEPLMVTLDNVIVSGHRRRCAAGVAGISTVPVRRINILSTDPRFEKYLVWFNKQRVKTPGEQIKEEIIRTSPDDAYYELLSHRAVEEKKAFQRATDADLRIIDPALARRRCSISPAKQPMLAAAIAIMERYRSYWPLTLRQIHYRLLGKGVLRNAKNPDSVYANTEESYKDLSDLLVWARLAGDVPWESMHDPTRPRTCWIQYPNVGTYIRKQLDGFLCGYRRNLHQSQPAHVELVVEKITVQEIAERAAGPYQVPVGVGRGYSSVTNLEETAERFRASGKDRLILLVAGDFDPEGEDIVRTWAACLRDEHGVGDILPIKIGVNHEHVAQFNLAPLPIKETSSRAAGFEAAHGKNVYELEAFEPDQLQKLIREAIRNVLDLGRFAEEQRRESEDARYVMACRKQVLELLKDLPLGEGLSD